MDDIAVVHDLAEQFEAFFSARLLAQILHIRLWV